MASSEHPSDSSSSIANKLSVEAENENNKPQDKPSEEVRHDMTELSGMKTTGQLDKEVNVLKVKDKEKRVKNNVTGHEKKKRSPNSSSKPKETKKGKKGSCGLSSSLDDEVGFPADIKLESTNDCIPEDDKDFKVCVVCGEKASGFYFGALVCLPCKSFYIRCTKDGEPTFTCQCNGNCDIAKQGRIRCQYCRYQRCLLAGMCRKEKPETVQPAEGQVLCKVCGDIANGIHFGVNTCEGCKKFFRRGLVENQGYNCKGEKSCQINPRNRNNCRYCRYQKCITAGMSREAIKMGRPKKSDGDSPNQSPSHSPAFHDRRSPELSPHGSPQSIHISPQLSPKNDSVFHKYMMSSPVKTETTGPPPSCQIQSEMTMSRPVVSSSPFMNLKTEEHSIYKWTSSVTASNWPVSQASLMTPQCEPTPPVMSSHQQENALLIEDDMDDILNFIQMDQASRTIDHTNIPYSDNNSCLYPSTNFGPAPLMVNTCDNFPQNAGQNSSFQHYHQPNQSDFYPDSQSPHYYQQSQSPQTNCHSPQSYNTPSPGECHSPQSYQATSTTVPDYPQQAAYPNHNTPSQQQIDMNTIPTPFMDIDNQNIINQMFIRCCGSISDQPAQIRSGISNRDELCNEVISITLKTASFRNSDCLYSSDDNSSCDSATFSHIASNKRKNCSNFDQSCLYGPNYTAQSSSGFTCERYSLQATQNYWKQQFPFDQMSQLSEQDRSVIQQLLMASSTMKYVFDESKAHLTYNMNKEEHWPKRGKEQAHWMHVQERIIRNNKAFVEFCMTIPGFNQLDPSDKEELCQVASFQAGLILSATEWYNRPLKKFIYFWNWTVSPENPMYLFKLHLLQAGEAINKLDLSPVELAFTLALSCISAEVMHLQDPTTIESIRGRLIYILQHHLAEQGVNPMERLPAIFNIMPMSRHISVWHKQLLKYMRINLELGAVSKLVEEITI